MFNNTIFAALMLFAAFFVREIDEVAGDVYMEFNDTHGRVYQIRDLPVSEYERAAELLLKQHAGKMLNPVLSMGGYDLADERRQTYKLDYITDARHNLSLACFKNGTNEMVGVDILTFTHRGNDKSIPDMDFEILKDFIQVYNFDVFYYYDVNAYIKSTAMVIDPEKVDNRKDEEEILFQFLKCREMVCRKADLEVASGIFFTAAENVAARRAGFSDINKSFTFSEAVRGKPQYNRLEPAFANMKRICRRTKRYN